MSRRSLSPEYMFEGGILALNLASFDTERSSERKTHMCINRFWGSAESWVLMEVTIENSSYDHEQTGCESHLVKKLG